MTEYSDSDFRLFFEEIRSAAEFSTAFAATQLFLNLSFFPPLRILSHLNFFKQWVMSIFCKFFVVNSYDGFFLSSENEYLVNFHFLRKINQTNCYKNKICN